MKIKPGLYKHSKSGRMYKVLGLAHHSEDLSELVVYEAQYDSDEFGPNAIWARPMKMFTETVEIDGQTVPRFQFVG
jgi:hypothetical protein